MSKFEVKDLGQADLILGIKIRENKNLLKIDRSREICGKTF